MKTFDFYLDQKHTIWYRDKFSIEAETQEEANEKVKELYRKNELPSDDWDRIDDTLEWLSVEDNGGEPTEELFTHDGVLIINNKPQL